MKPYPFKDKDDYDVIIDELKQLNIQFRIMNNLLLDISKTLKELVKTSG
jgi:hypothetical protein